ncbi:MAG: hypothetical protein EHM21_08710, partial [Chloroflexi bacterium]
MSAPPGYGKTTLVSSWLGETGLPFTWLSLDEGDNDPIRFLEYFLTALHKVVPAIRLDLLDLLQGSQAAPNEAILALLINETASAGDFFLVLDDFHAIHEQPVLDMVAYLLDHLPPVIHLVVLSRTDPPLALSRLRARSQLLEIRAEQLRFTKAEIALFYRNNMGLDLSDPEVSAIETRTEGWVAGLQLAGLAIQSYLASPVEPGTEGKNPHTFITAFTGSHAYVMDYLTEEVLRCQPASIRSFLLQTSILERMCGPLCEAVVLPGRTEQLNGQAMLEFIALQHLFVIPLDTERDWYRYHHLFKEVLSRRFEVLFPEQVPDLHQRASEWYENHGFIYEAIQHALKAKDLDRTARLVEAHGCDLLMSGEVVTLADWLAAIEPYTLVRPWLAMQKAWVLLLLGNLERAEQAIDAGEKLLSTCEPTGEVKTMRGSFAAARAHWANLQGKTALASDYARRAIEFLSDSGDFSCSLRILAITLLGDACWTQGKLKEARQAYSEAARIGQVAGNQHMAMMSNTNLADVLFEQGQLHQAASLYSETLRMAERADGPNSAYAPNIHFGLSRVFYAQNRLDEAGKAIEKCSKLSCQWGNTSLQAACLVVTAQIAWAMGDVEKAQETVYTAEQWMKEHAISSRWLGWSEPEIARLALHQGNIEKALFLVRKAGICADILSLVSLSMTDIVSDEPIPYPLEPDYLILARLFLALNHPDAALAVCDRLLLEADAEERVNVVTELLVLQALAFQSKKDSPTALAALEIAIARAWPEESTRVFLDEGEAMGKLLYLAKAHNKGGEFV